MNNFKENLHNDLLAVRQLLLDHFDQYYMAVIQQADKLEKANVPYNTKNIVYDLNAYVFDSFSSSAEKLNELKERS